MVGNVRMLLTFVKGTPSLRQLLQQTVNWGHLFLSHTHIEQVTFVPYSGLEEPVHKFREKRKRELSEFCFSPQPHRQVKSTRYIHRE